jgi:hypothetical protein
MHPDENTFDPNTECSDHRHLGLRHQAGFIALRGSYMRVRAMLIALVLSVGAAAAGIAQPTMRRADATIVRLERVAPAPDSLSQASASPAPRARPVDLSHLQIFEGLTATSTFVLTPAQPVAANRGMLAFHLANVNPGSRQLAPGGHASAFRSERPGSIRVQVYATPGRTYVIDLHIIPDNVAESAPPLQLHVGSDASDDLQPLFVNADNRALIAFAPTAAGWHHFTIVPSRESSRPHVPASFDFISATISVLQ